MLYFHAPLNMGYISLINHGIIWDIMAKKSQVSLFLIFGIVMVAGVMLISYLSSSSPQAESLKKAEVPSASETIFSIEPVKLNIGYCAESSLKDAIEHMGFYGGYYLVPEPKIDYFGQEIPLYAQAGKNTAPSINEIESQIAEYVKEQLPLCVNQLQFEGIAIQGDIKSVSAVIGAESVSIYADYAIEARMTDKTSTISSTRAEVPARLHTVYEIAANISNEAISGNAVCMDCLIELAEQHNVFIDVQVYGDNVIYTIFDNQTNINNDEYIFSFATD